MFFVYNKVGMLLSGQDYFQSLCQKFMVKGQEKNPEPEYIDNDERTPATKIMVRGGAGLLGRLANGQMIFQRNGKIYRVNKLREMAGAGMSTPTLLLGLAFLTACGGGSAVSTKSGGSVGAGVTRAATLSNAGTIVVSGTSATADNFVITGNSSQTNVAELDLGDERNSSVSQKADSVTIAADTLQNLGGKAITLRNFGPTDTIILKTKSGNIASNSDSVLPASAISKTISNGSWTLRVDLDGNSATSNDILTFNTDIASSTNFETPITSGSTIVKLNFAPQFSAPATAIATAQPDNLATTAFSANGIKINAFEDASLTSVTFTALPDDITIYLNNQTTISSGVTINASQFNSLQYGLKATAIGLNFNETSTFTISDGVNSDQTGTISFKLPYTGALGANNLVSGTAGGDKFDLTNDSQYSTTDVNIVGGAGNDSITTWNGNDVIRGGGGVDVINPGGGENIIVLVGRGYSKTYNSSDLVQSYTNALGSQTVDLGVKIGLTADELNNSNTTDFTGDSITNRDIINLDAGSADDNTIIIFGDFDLDELAINNFNSATDEIKINSKAKISAEKLQIWSNMGVRIIGGTDSELIIVNNNSATPSVFSFTSTTNISGFGKLTIGKNMDIQVTDVARFVGAVAAGGIVGTQDSSITNSSITILAPTVDNTTLLKGADTTQLVFGNNVNLGNRATNAGPRTNITAENLGARSVASSITINNTGGLDFVAGSSETKLFGTTFGDTFKIGFSGTNKLTTGAGRDVITLNHASLVNNVSITDFDENDKLIISQTAIITNASSLTGIIGLNLADVFQSVTADGNLEIIKKRGLNLAPVSRVLRENIFYDASQVITGNIYNYTNNTAFTSTTDYGTITINSSGAYSYTISADKFNSLTNAVQDVININIGSTNITTGGNATVVMNLLGVNDTTSITQTNRVVIGATTGSISAVDTGLVLNITDADTAIISTSIINDDRFYVGNDNHVYLRANTSVNARVSQLNLLVRTTDILGATTDKNIILGVSGALPFDGGFRGFSNIKFAANESVGLVQNGGLEAGVFNFAPTRLRIRDNPDSEFKITLASTVQNVFLSTTDDGGDIILSFNSQTTATQINTALRLLRIADAVASVASSGVISYELLGADNAILSQFTGQVQTYLPNIAPLVSGLGTTATSENSSGLLQVAIVTPNFAINDENNLNGGYITFGQNVYNTSMDYDIGFSHIGNNLYDSGTGSLVATIDTLRNGQDGQGLKINFLRNNATQLNDIVRSISLVSPDNNTDQIQIFITAVDNEFKATSSLQTINITQTDIAGKLSGLAGDRFIYAQSGTNVGIDVNRDGLIIDPDNIKLGTKLIFSSTNIDTSLTFDGSLPNYITSASSDGDLTLTFTASVPAQLASQLIQRVRYKNSTLSGASDTISVTLDNPTGADDSAFVKIDFVKPILPPDLPDILPLLKYTEDSPAVSLTTNTAFTLPGGANVENVQFTVQLARERDGGEVLIKPSTIPTGVSVTALDANAPDSGFMVKFAANTAQSVVTAVMNGFTYSGSSNFSAPERLVRYTLINTATGGNDATILSITTSNVNDSPVVSASVTSTLNINEPNNQSYLGTKFLEISITDEETINRNNFLGTKLVFSVAGANGLVDVHKIQFIGYETNPNGVLTKVGDSNRVLGNFNNGILNFSESMTNDIFKDLLANASYTYNSLSPTAPLTITLNTNFYDSPTATPISIARQIDLQFANDGPIITSPAIDQSYIESDAPEGRIYFSGIVGANDEETPNGLTYKIKTANGDSGTANTEFGSLFINQATGKWEFAGIGSRVDALAANAISTTTFSVVVSDGSTTALQIENFRFTGADDPAHIWSHTNSEVTLDASTPSLSTGTFSVSDIDNGGIAFSYFAPNQFDSNYGSLTINSVTGDWSFAINSAVLANNTIANIYTAEIRATDGTNTISRMVNFTLGNAPQAPRFDDAFSAASVAEGVAVNIFSNANNDTRIIYDPNNERQDNYAGFKIRLQKYNVSNSQTSVFNMLQESLTISGAGTSYIIVNNVIKGSDSVTDYASITHNNTESIITFNSNTNRTRFKNILGELQYINANSTTSHNHNEYLSITLIDNTNSMAGALASFTIIARDDAPSITNSETYSYTITDTASFNMPARIIGKLTATDAEGDTIQFGINGVNQSSNSNYGSLTLTANGGDWSFTFNNDGFNKISAGESVTLNYSFYAYDTISGVNASSSKALNITLVGENDAPFFANVASQSSFTITSPNTASLTNSVTAGDYESNTLTYHVATPINEWGSMTIDSNGIWKLQVNKSRYDQLGGGASASTIFSIAAFDGSITTLQGINFNFTGINDDPYFTTPSFSTLVINNGAASLDINGDLRAQDADNTTLRYGLTNSTTLSSVTDYGALTINSETGHWIFNVNETSVALLHSSETKIFDFSYSVFDNFSNPASATGHFIVTILGSTIGSSTETGIYYTDGTGDAIYSGATIAETFTYNFDSRQIITVNNTQHDFGGIIGIGGDDVVLKFETTSTNPDKIRLNDTNNGVSHIGGIQGFFDAFMNGSFAIVANQTHAGFASDTRFLTLDFEDSGKIGNADSRSGLGNLSLELYSGGLVFEYNSTTSFTLGNNTNLYLANDDSHFNSNFIYSVTNGANDQVTGSNAQFNNFLRLVGENIFVVESGASDKWYSHASDGTGVALISNPDSYLQHLIFG